MKNNIFTENINMIFLYLIGSIVSKNNIYRKYNSGIPLGLITVGAMAKNEASMRSSQIF